LDEVILWVVFGDGIVLVSGFMSPVKSGPLEEVFVQSDVFSLSLADCFYELPI
jgi:hypothetical protein